MWGSEKLRAEEKLKSPLCCENIPSFGVELICSAAKINMVRRHLDVLNPQCAGVCWSMNPSTGNRSPFLRLVGLYPPTLVFSGAQCQCCTLSFAILFFYKQRASSSISFHSTPLLPNLAFFLWHRDGREEMEPEKEREKKGERDRQKETEKKRKKDPENVC